MILEDGNTSTNLVDNTPLENTSTPDNETLLQIVEQDKEEENPTDEPINIEHRRILNSILTELSPIDFRVKAELQDGETLTQKHQVIITIQEILQKAIERHWSLCLNETIIYLYNGAEWSEIHKDVIRNFLGEAAEKLGVDPFVARYFGFREILFKQFMTIAYLPKPIRKSNEVLINLKNGTFVITPEKQFIRDFDRNDFLTYQLPFCWNEQATAPIFQ
jgi:putative DNA primase/helicase